MGKTVTLSPVKESTEDYEAIEKAIAKLFREELYLPVLRLAEIETSVLKNAKYDLAGAIAAGRVTFYRGQFKGRFSASISRELRDIGAKWDRKQGCWKIPLGDLPPHIVDAISRSESKFDRILQRIDSLISDFLPEKIAEKISLRKLFSRTIFRVNRDIEKSVQGITVVPKLTDRMSEKISEEYETNMKKYIKGWLEEEIVELRARVKKSVLTGNRHENLVKTIQKSYQVSYSKAKFLARQETSLMTSKFKESRYISGGVTEYMWGCVAGSPKHPVRASHKALEGKVFSWKNPPITSPDGKRNNPGEDFNCRCFAKPVVRFK